MNRLFSLLAAFFLVACARSDDQGKAPATAIPVAPVSAAESSAIRAAVLTGHAGPGDQALVAAQGATGSCADFVGQLQDFLPGTLEVPEDWDHPDTSPKIQVFYYYRKGFGEAEKRAPVVFFNGGPSSDSHGSAQLLADLAFTRNSSMVFIDQRGTGCSTNYPAELTEANARRLMSWGSRAIALDAEAVRKHLFGGRRWRLYGQSYGGFIVHRYLEVAPEGVDRAIAHGASIMKDGVAWMIERLRSQQRIGESYFARFPQDRAALAGLRKRIPDTQCWKSGETAICGAAVLDSLTILLGFQDSWPSLHLWVSSLSQGGGLNREALERLVRSFVFGVYAEGGLAGNVISKMEIAGGYDDQTGCDESLKRMRAAGDKPDEFPINECRLLGGMQTPYGALMRGVGPRPVSLERIKANLTQGSQQFFLFSGQQDAFVPFATFSEEVAFLGKQVRYESFPNSGHEGFYTEPHVIGAVSDVNETIK